MPTPWIENSSLLRQCLKARQSQRRTPLGQGTVEVHVLGGVRHVRADGFQLVSGKEWHTGLLFGLWRTALEKTGQTVPTTRLGFVGDGDCVKICLCVF